MRRLLITLALLGGCDDGSTRRDAPAPDAQVEAIVDAMPDVIVDATADVVVDAMPDAIVDATADATTDAMADASVDAMPAAPCAPWIPPAGLGGVAHAQVDYAEAERWLAFRHAREQERLLEAWDPPRVQARYRVEQAAIDAGCLDTAALVDLGRGLFLRAMTPAEGYGHGLGAPRLRRFQRGQFGGPDAARCADCHWKGGFAGGGDRADNSFLYGDGDDESTHDARNPPALWGAGWTERIGAEMTAELQGQRAAAVARARAESAAVDVPLQAKGIAFGLLRVASDGNVDASAIEGVDADLVVKPFGWKGVFPTLRAFARHSLHIHFTLQSEELLAEPGDVDLGPGPADDPDADGVRREISEGQLTALVVFLATLDAPVFAVPTEGDAGNPLLGRPPELVEAPEFIARWLAGSQRFEALGCAGCHVPFMPVDDAVYRTRASLSGGEVAIDLAREGAHPLPPRADDGRRWLVPVFSDFKRHDLGPGLAARHIERGVPVGVYLTRRLWGAGQTGPYLHDGSAVTFDEAIARHGGEAAFAAEGFLALPEAHRADLRVFLASLRRAPAIRVR